MAELLELGLERDLARLVVPIFERLSLRERVITAANELYAAKRESIGPEIMEDVEKSVLLQILDQLWREHLITLEHLRQAVALRGYGQRDPLNEYKTESFTLFEAMIAKMREETTSYLMRIEKSEEPQGAGLPFEDELPEMEAHHIDPFTGEDDMDVAAFAFGDPAQAGDGGPRDGDDQSTWGKVGRNEKCPCGSGKKFKHCHGALV